ncbi:hypothetical protein [Thermasporomyces composti]|nr:hypothetical protein [Thermasporomyces composti]
MPAHDEPPSRRSPKWDARQAWRQMPVSAAVVLGVGVGLLVQLLYIIGVELAGRPLGSLTAPVGWGLFLVAGGAFFTWWWRWSRETRERRSRRRRR